MIRSCAMAVAISLTTLAAPATAATLCVDITGGCPGSFSEVQAALAAAQPGDVIDVYPGTYPPFLVTVNDVTIRAALAGAGNEPVIDATLTGIFSLNGRGVVIDSTITPSVDEVTLERLIVRNGSAVSAVTDGAGIYVRAASARIEQCQIESCIANGNGGGVFVFGTGPSGRTVIFNTDVTDCSANRGGGVYASAADVLIEGGVISLCDATTGGGGVYIEGSPPAGKPQVFGVEVNDNSAGVGGGIYLGMVDAEVRGCDVHHNTTSSGSNHHGAGVYATASSVLFDTCVIRNNSADDHGGGVYATGPGAAASPTVRFLLSDIHDNVAGSDGGGLYLGGGQDIGGVDLFAVLDNCNIHHNDGDYGGGVRSGDGVTLSADHTRISFNNALTEGGGVYTIRSKGSVYTNCTLEGNYADFDGGALSMRTELPSGLHDQLTNCLIVANTADSTGGGIYLSNAAPRIATTTIANNVATAFGGGVYVAATSQSGPAAIDSCIISGNVDLSNGTNNGPSEEIFFAGTTTALVSYTDWEQWTPAAAPCTGCQGLTATFATGPTSASQPNGGYYLPQTGPLVDAGNPATDATVLLTTAPYITATTDPAGVIDGSNGLASDVVDCGFHYNGSPKPPVFSLLTDDIPIDPLTGDKVISFGAIQTTDRYTFTLESAASPLPGVTSSTWFLLGSATGTAPGLPVNGVVLPLTLDFYMQATLLGSGLFLPTTSLPANGSIPSAGGTTTVLLDPNLIPPGAVGLTLYHAYLVYDMSSSNTLTRHPSNPAKFRIDP